MVLLVSPTIICQWNPGSTFQSSVFDLLEPVTLLATPSFSASHSLFLWTDSLPVDLICLWLLLYRIPFLCPFLCPQMLMFPRVSVLCSLFTLSSPCTDSIHLSGFTLNVVDFQIFIPSHVTPPEFQLHPSHAHLNILQTSQTMHLWNWSHYLIHPKLSLLPYPLPWKYHHSLQCIHEGSAFFIPYLKSITLLVKSLISMNRNQLKLPDWGCGGEGFVIKVQCFSQNPSKRAYLGLNGLRTVQWGFFPSLIFPFLGISVSFSCLS